MTKRQRETARAKANGEVFVASRKPAIPAHKIIQLKTRYKRNKRIAYEEV